MKETENPNRSDERLSTFYVKKQHVKWNERACSHHRRLLLGENGKLSNFRKPALRRTNFVYRWKFARRSATMVLRWHIRGFGVPLVLEYEGQAGRQVHAGHKHAGTAVSSRR